MWPTIGHVPYSSVTVAEPRNVEVSVLVSEAEFIDWNRAAARTDMDLSTWLCTRVNVKAARIRTPWRRLKSDPGS